MISKGRGVGSRQGSWAALTGVEARFWKHQAAMLAEVLSKGPFKIFK